LRRGSTSDSDYADADLSVPSADVVLDNSMTLLYSGGEADTDPPSSLSNESSTGAAATAGTDTDAGAMTRMPPPAKDGGHWLRFKYEILRLAHTLGLRGWRRVPLKAGGAIEVVRLSGALTNAVYLVSPPKRMPDEVSSTYRKPPA
jgi:choline kinase